MQEALNAVKFFGWLKNIVGPVKGQGKGIKHYIDSDLITSITCFSASTTTKTTSSTTTTSSSTTTTASTILGNPFLVNH